MPFTNKSQAVAAALVLAGLSGCSAAYRRVHESPLIAISAAEIRGIGEEVASAAPAFEDLVVSMADDYGVRLQDVIPIRVYIDGERPPAKSYYNRFTRAIVLCGLPDTAVFAHELSHLLSHRIASSPPYWSDQGLAEYMEARFDGKVGIRPGARSSGAAGAMESASERAGRLIRLAAGARDPSEILAHLTSKAEEEDRGWGVVVVRYLFESRWAGRPMSEKILDLFQLTESDVSAFAPAILEYCRRSEFLATRTEGQIR